MIKAIIFAILKFCLGFLYDYVDKNKDGKIDKEEIVELLNFIFDKTDKITDKISK